MRFVILLILLLRNYKYRQTKSFLLGLQTTFLNNALRLIEEIVTNHKEFKTSSIGGKSKNRILYEFIRCSESNYILDSSPITLKRLSENSGDWNFILLIL